MYDSSPPATHNRNPSRKPIDALWGTPGIDVERAGYSPFDHESPSVGSDHRMIWAEVSSLSILGKDVPHSSKAINTNRLKSNDPRCQKLYSKRVRRQYKSQNVFKSYKKLIKMKFESKFNDFHHISRRKGKTKQLL